MHRTARSLLGPLTFGLLVSFPLIGCQQSGGTNSSGGSSGSNSGGSAGSGNSSSSSGGKSSSSGGAAGSGNTSSNSGGSTVSSGSGGKSSSSGGAAGSGNGGQSAGGAAGNGSGGSSSSGSAGNGGGNGSGGVAGGAAGSSTGTGGAAGAAGSGTASTDPTMISDFEDTPGQATMDPNGGRTGYWYVYFPGSGTASAPASPMTISPAIDNGKPVATAKSSAGGYALHFTGSGYNTSPNNYAGTGANFSPHVPFDSSSSAYDVSKYTGISFQIQSGTGTPPALFFEMLTKENQPSTAGGTATQAAIDLYNTRGQMIYTPWTPNAISSTWQTVNVPFGTLIPRWVPAAGSSAGSSCTAGSSTPPCQAPAFVPTDALGLQFSFYEDSGWPDPTGSTAGTFDIWLDNVKFTTDDSVLQTQTGFPLASSGTWGSCLKPAGASAGAKFLVPAYNMWKSTFVKSGAVVRPENGNDTVSEGIAYGMLIAVNMNDKTLFDSLYSYWSGHSTAGSLMTWCIAGGSGSCTPSGGSATDADEDAAFALLQADKVFGGGSYKSEAMTMIGDIWTHDIDGGGTNLPKGGSNYGSPSSAVTNASYFAPAYYSAFKAAGDTHDWDSVNTAVYKAIGAIAGSDGLIPAWCTSSCTSPGSNGAATDGDYQYDSHRIPMRIGLDYCWNGTAAAQSYTKLIVNFLASQGQDGIGFILDMYTPSGGAVSGTAPNSASILGTAAVGAMAAGNQSFLNAAYQSVFDSATRGTLAPTDASGKTPYSYFNGTVGMLTLLMMNGNFSH